MEQVVSHFAVESFTGCQFDVYALSLLRGVNGAFLVYYLDKLQPAIRVGPVSIRDVWM
jgi:hypothetical protein